MKTVLITGGMGFIGSHFVRYVLNKHSDWNVINLDKLTYAGNPNNLKDIDGNERYEFVQGDICDETFVNALAERSQMIVNFAAETHVDRSIEHASDFIQTNIQGTRVLLDASKKFDHELYFHVSTDEVYGSIQEGSFREDFPLVPNSPYASSKAGSDLLALAYATTYQTPIIISRCGNNYGPFQFPEKAIPLFVTNLIEGKKIPLYGDGKNVRDWIYVEDHCYAIDLLIEKGDRGQVYNIGTLDELQNFDLVNRILSEFSYDSAMIERVQDRLGHDFRYSLDTSKINHLGFKPKVPFETGLKNTVKWYKENEWWWQPLKKDKFTLK